MARALDDVTDMFIRQVNKMHHKAEEALMQYQVAHADRTDALIAVLREITLAYKAEGSREERLALIETLLEKDADQILAQCMAHETVAGSNHLSFLHLFYNGRRSTLFLFLESTSRSRRPKTAFFLMRSLSCWPTKASIVNGWRLHMLR